MTLYPQENSQARSLSYPKLAESLVAMVSCSDLRPESIFCLKPITLLLKPFDLINKGLKQTRHNLYIIAGTSFLAADGILV